jgi:hypothetical protein
LRSAPSFFSLASDFQADVATTGDLHTKYLLQELTKAIKLLPPPSQAELMPALADPMNPPLSQDEQNTFNNDSFVDNNGSCAIWSNIIPAIQQSMLAAFVLFGWPDSDRRGSCIAPNKWDSTVSFSVLFLGYHINSRSMMVTWPFYKRQALYDDIQDALKSQNRSITPKLAASILGKICSVGGIAPWGW